MLALIIKLVQNPRDLLNRPHPDRFIQPTRLHQRQHILRGDHHVFPGVHQIGHFRDRTVVNAAHLTGGDNAGNAARDIVQFVGLVTIKPKRLDRDKTIRVFSRIQRPWRREKPAKLQRIGVRLQRALLHALGDENHLFLAATPYFPHRCAFKRVGDNVAVLVFHADRRVIKLDLVADLVAELVAQSVPRHQMAECNPFDFLPGTTGAVAEISPVHMLKLDLLALQIIIWVAHFVGFFAEHRIVPHPRDAASANLLILDRQAHVPVEIAIIHRERQRTLQDLGDFLADRVGITIPPPHIRRRRLIV